MSLSVVNRVHEFVKTSTITKKVEEHCCKLLQKRWLSVTVNSMTCLTIWKD